MAEETAVSPIKSTRFQTYRPGFRAYGTNPVTGNRATSAYRGGVASEDKSQSLGVEGGGSTKTNRIGEVYAGDDKPRPNKSEKGGSININIGGGKGLGDLSPVKDAISNVSTAFRYGTNIGSQQTSMLAAQDAGLGVGGFGGAMGAGLFAGVGTLIMGGSIKDAAISGISTAVGFAIGGPIGGAIGGIIGSVFCFAPNTLIRMADGSHKKIKDLEIGDEVYLGGMVIGVGKALAIDLFEYKGLCVTGAHAVFEDGGWTRVKNSTKAIPIDDLDDPATVIPLATARHLIVSGDVISSDMIEVDNSDSFNDVERIGALNSMTWRNDMLKVASRILSGEATSVAA